MILNRMGKDGNFKCGNIESRKWVHCNPYVIGDNGNIEKLI